MRNKSQQQPLLTWSLGGQLLTIGAFLLLAGCAQFPPVAGTPSPAEVDAQPEVDTETAAATPQAIPEPQEDPEPDKLHEWNGSGRDISHVVIDTNAQRARFYDGQEQVGWTTIASGVSSHPTPSGEFEVMEKVAKKRSNLYGRIYNASGGLHKRNARSSDPVPAGGKFVGARMPHFMRMTYDGIGMHAGAIPRPGHPASHGCIRLPDEIASSLFAHTGIGTRVTVIGQGPDYGDYAERIRRQREQERVNQAAVAKAETSSNASKPRSAATSTNARNNQRQGVAAEASVSTQSSGLAEPSSGETGPVSTSASPNIQVPDPPQTSTARADRTGTAVGTRSESGSAPATIKEGELPMRPAAEPSSAAQPGQESNRAPESTAVKSSAPSSQVSGQQQDPKDSEQPNARSQATTPAPATGSRQTVPPRPHEQKAPTIRSADHADSTTVDDSAENEQS